MKLFDAFFSAFNIVATLVLYAVLIVELAKGRGIDNEMLFLWIAIWGTMISGKLNKMN